MSRRAPSNVTHTIVIRVPAVPRDTNVNSQPHKEYHIPASRLPSSFHQQNRLSITDEYASIRVVTLQDTSVEQFDIYEDWLRHGKVLTTSEFVRKSQASLAMTLGQSIGLFRKKAYRVTPEEARRDYNVLLSCYVLGTSLSDQRFKDCVATKLVSLLRSPGSHQSQLICLLTRNGVQSIINRYGSQSRIFVLLTNAYARFATAHEIGVLAFSNYPGDFKSHVMKELALLRAKQHVDGAPAADFAVGVCRFHTHGFYEACLARSQ